MSPGAFSRNSPVIVACGRVFRSHPIRRSTLVSRLSRICIFCRFRKMRGFTLLETVLITHTFASGHTALNTPDPIRTRKLSSARPGQYWGGGPPGKSLGCCWLFSWGFSLRAAPRASPATWTQHPLNRAEPQTQGPAPTLITRRGKTEKSVFGFRAARCCKQKLILSFPPFCGVGLVLLQSLLKAADEN